MYSLETKLSVICECESVGNDNNPSQLCSWRKGFESLRTAHLLCNDQKVI